MRYVRETEKISVTLPIGLIEILERLKEERGYSRSGFIRKAVEHQILVEFKNQAMVEGVYRDLFDL